MQLYILIIDIYTTYLNLLKYDYDIENKDKNTLS